MCEGSFVGGLQEAPAGFTPADQLSQLFKRLVVLDRYERAALARRNKTIRAEMHRVAAA